MLVNNNSFTLNVTNSKHFGMNGDIVKGTDSSDPTSSFANALSNAFNKVNNLETHAEKLQQQMVSDPESVNLHDVTIAQTEAELALSFTKSISSRVISAFNELTNLR